MSKKLREYFSSGTVSMTISLCVAVAFFLALSHISAVKAIADKIFGVVSPFVYAFALAFILNRPMMWFERKLFSRVRMKRTLSIISVYRALFLFLGFIFTSIIPQLGRSLSYLAEIIPGFLDSLGNTLNEIIGSYHWTDSLIAQVNDAWRKIITSVTEISISALPGILNIVVSLGSGIINVLMVLIISVYLLADKERLLFQMKKACYAFLSKERADRMVYIAHRSDRIFSGFIIGKLIDSTIIGFLCFGGMMVICSQYSTLIAVIIGVTNMIPFFGPFIGAVPAIFILLTVSPKTAAVFTLFVFILQQLDGNLIGPKILGNSLGLSPIWVLAGILVGNGLFGITGMLIGVPTFAVLYSLTAENIRDRLKEKKINADYETNTVGFADAERENADEAKI